MPATVTCNCGTNLTVDDTAKGTSIVCPQCGAAVARADIIYDAEEVIEPDSLEEVCDAVEEADDDTSASRRPCPACGESIAAAAKKCRFCGEFFDGSTGQPIGRLRNSANELTITERQVLKKFHDYMHGISIFSFFLSFLFGLGTLVGALSETVVGPGPFERGIIFVIMGSLTVLTLWIAVGDNGKQLWKPYAFGVLAVLGLFGSLPQGNIIGIVVFLVALWTSYGAISAANKLKQSGIALTTRAASKPGRAFF